MLNALNISCIKLCVRAVNCCTRNFLFLLIFKFGWHCLSSDVGADSFGPLLFSFSPYLSVTTLKIQTTLLCLNRPLCMFLFNNFFLKHQTIIVLCLPDRLPWILYRYLWFQQINLQSGPASFLHNFLLEKRQYVCWKSEYVHIDFLIIYIFSIFH